MANKTIGHRIESACMNLRNVSSTYSLLELVGASGPDKNLLPNAVKSLREYREICFFFAEYVAHVRNMPELTSDGKLAQLVAATNVQASLKQSSPKLKQMWIKAIEEYNRSCLQFVGRYGGFS